MRRCLQLARCGEFYAKPNPMVGAVIVADGRIIGEGYHVRCGEGHAEVNAFASVSPADEHLLPEATIYVSLEPCSHWGKTPPCADLIVKKGVRRAGDRGYRGRAGGRVQTTEQALLHLPQPPPPVHNAEMGADSKRIHRQRRQTARHINPDSSTTEANRSPYQPPQR